MKKILCYLGIFVLLILAFLPPILRILLPDHDDVKVENEIKESVVLSCTGDNYITNTSYQNNQVQMIVIKKVINIEPNQEGLEDTNQDNQNNSLGEIDLDKIFENIKKSSDIIHDVLDDGEVVRIDFSISNHQELELDKIAKTPEEQKKYYESQNLNCVIRK